MQAWYGSPEYSVDRQSSRQNGEQARRGDEDKQEDVFGIRGFHVDVMGRHD